MIIDLIQSLTLIPFLFASKSDSDHVYLFAFFPSEIPLINSFVSDLFISFVMHLVLIRNLTLIQFLISDVILF